MSEQETETEDLPSLPQHQVGDDGKPEPDQEPACLSHCKQGAQLENKTESETEPEGPISNLMFMVKAEAESAPTFTVKAKLDSVRGHDVLLSVSQSLNQVEADDLQSCANCEPSKSDGNKRDTNMPDSINPGPVRARKSLLEPSLPPQSLSLRKRVRGRKSERETLAVKLFRAKQTGAIEGELQPRQQGESGFEYDLNGIQIPSLYQNAALAADPARTHDDGGSEGATSRAASTVMPSSLDVHLTTYSSAKTAVQPHVEAFPVRVFPNYHLARDGLDSCMPLDLTRCTSARPSDLTLKPLDLTQHSTAASNLTTVPLDMTKKPPDSVSVKAGPLLKCQTCSATFSSRHNLRIHAQIHTDEKRFKCGQCPAAFSRVSSLKDHHKTHTGEKPHVCMLCGSAFSKMSSLKDHTRVHTGEKPYGCEFCSAAFSQQTSLKKHTRTHTGEKPYQCDQCDAAFTQQTNLKTHLRIHSGEKPYKCDFCHSAFSQLAGLRKHSQTHTRDRPSRNRVQCDSDHPVKVEALQA